MKSGCRKIRQVKSVGVRRFTVHCRSQFVVVAAFQTVYKSIFFHFLRFLYKVHTLFQKQISRTFLGLFQDSDWFFKGSEIYINPYTPKISMFILLTAFHTLHIFLVEFSKFPELSRTSKRVSEQAASFPVSFFDYAQRSIQLASFQSVFSSCFFQEF